MTQAIPRHVAIIMDGNGRWARERGWARIRGHRAGVQAVRDVATRGAEVGLEQLTLYAFSTENWSRPQREIALLFRLLKQFLVRERPTIMDNAIRLTSIGDLSRLPDDVTTELETTRAMSAGNDGMHLCLALNYGSRQEIAGAVQTIARQVADGALAPDAITPETIEAHLDTAGRPEPDLLIRTSGEQRLSNFLLWQLSYAEFWFTDVYWPDFRAAHLDEALAAFAGRERRFGDVGSQDVGSAGVAAT